MLPPYRTDEVATAVLHRLHDTGAPARSVTVRADDAPRTWSISATLQNGRRVAAEYAFADVEGIHTPAELAEWFAANVAAT